MFFKRVNAQHITTTGTATEKSINPFPILELLMHEAITEFPICLQALVALTLSSVSTLHLFNARE